MGIDLPRALALTLAATNLHAAYQQTSIVMPGLVPGTHFNIRRKIRQSGGPVDPGAAMGARRAIRGPRP
jgi:hypothetical protein